MKIMLKIIILHVVFLEVVNLLLMIVMGICELWKFGFFFGSLPLTLPQTLVLEKVCHVV